jgi:hypothetical protein
MGFIIKHKLISLKFKSRIDIWNKESYKRTFISKLRSFIMAEQKKQEELKD